MRPARAVVIALAACAMAAAGALAMSFQWAPPDHDWGLHLQRDDTAEPSFELDDAEAEALHPGLPAALAQAKRDGKSVLAVDVEDQPRLSKTLFQGPTHAFRHEGHTYRFIVYTP